MQFYFAIVGLPMSNRGNKRYLPVVLLRKMLYCTREQFASFLQGTVAAAPIPRSGHVSIERVGEDPGNEVDILYSLDKVGLSYNTAHNSFLNSPRMNDVEAQVISSGKG